MDIKQLIVFVKKTHKIPLHEAEILLCFVLKKNLAHLLAHPDKKITKNQENKFIKYCKQRSTGKPIAYITKQKEFYGLNFYVDKNVLIPRPETELLVDEALKYIKKSSNKNLDIIDIGTGSGAIITALTYVTYTRYVRYVCHNPTRRPLCNIPAGHSLNFFAIDYKKEILKIAKKNVRQIASLACKQDDQAKKNKTFFKINFLKGNLLEPYLSSPLFQRGARGDLSRHLVILANLPYLSTKQLEETDISVKKHEPKNALIGGKDSLKYFKELIEQINCSHNILAKSKRKISLILLEIDPRNVKITQKLFKNNLKNLKSIEVLKDLSGKDRIVKIALG